MKKLAALAVIVMMVAAGSIYLYTKTRHGSSTTPYTRPIDHIVIILEENKPAGRIIGSSAAPYLNHLLKTVALAQNYHAITHPSLPNYIALTSGTTAGITTDCLPASADCRATVPNIADLLEKSGRSWKEYAESMPTACMGTNAGTYAVKHNPFMYYPDIAANTGRCASHVVPFSQFNQDLSGKLPDYSFVTPNLCNDMHDCSVQTGDVWLSQQVPRILQSAAFTKEHSLLVIIWDEGSAADNHIPAIFAGPAARSGYSSTTSYSHYSLLHTIEYVWNLRPLTEHDTAAPVMTDMLQ